jgi:hypothetical protein
MRHLSTLLTLLALAAPIAAQNCFDGNFGTRVARNVADWLSPVLPIGFAFPLGGQSYTGMYVTDHGFVALTNNGQPPPPPNPSLYSPSLANFRLSSPKVCAFYADVVAIDGEIFVDSQPGRCLITWRSLQHYLLPNQRYDLQLALFPNGDVRIVFGPGLTNTSAFGGVANNAICGLSLGGGFALPTASDLSLGGATTANSFHELWTVPFSFDLASTTLVCTASGGGYQISVLGAGTNCASAPRFGTGCGGIAQSPLGLPTFGNPTYGLRVDDVPASSPLAVFSLGNPSNPGFPLASIGMPNCDGYDDIAFGLYVGTPTVSGRSDLVFAIPSTPSLMGVQFASQGLAFSPLTPLGLIATNGVTSTVGMGF